MSKHTPGPWIWRINKATKHIRLSGRGFTVMDFWRYGMRSAAPRFLDSEHLMVRADELAVVILGEEHHADWNMDIDHPDARLIAAAPDLLAALKEMTEEVSELLGDGLTKENAPYNLKKAWEEIAKAEGKEGA